MRMMDIDLCAISEGVRLRVKARPGAGRNAITGVHNGAVRIGVTAAAEKGKANASITKLLAKTLGIAKSRIALTSGHTSSEKVFTILHTSVDDVHEAILAAIPRD